MNNLLDNDQITRVRDIVGLTSAAYERVGINNTAMGLVIESCHAKACAAFYTLLYTELKQYHPHLAIIATGASDRINDILEED